MDRTDEDVNVGDIERYASALAGGALLILGLTRRSPAGLGLVVLGGSLLHRGLTGRCMAYAAAGVNTAGGGGGYVGTSTGKGGWIEAGDGLHNPNATVGHGEGIKVYKSVTVDKPAAELYRFWRNFENLPRFMKHVESVTVKDDRNSHWVVKAPAGRRVEWDAEIINEQKNELIAWRSVGDADVDNAGSVRFEELEGDRGTKVTVNLEYKPPAGKVGVVVAKLFHEEPGQQVEEDLRRFKQVMETGEIATTDGQPTGR
jgi:uncharacterized membrane protein